MEMPKKVLLACATLVLAALPALAQTKVVFASDCTFPPMEFVDANKNLVGFDIDLVKAVGKAGGFEAVVKNTAWDGIFAGLTAGGYDAVVSAVTITPERQKTMDFSAPYVNAGQVIVVKKSVAGITTLNQLAGKKVGVQIGTTGAIEVAKNKAITGKIYDEAGLAVEDLFLGRVDAVVIDGPTASSYVLQNDKYKGALKIVGKPFTQEHYGIAVKKGNQKILAMINKGLAAVIKDGTVAKLSKKWLQ